MTKLTAPVLMLLGGLGLTGTAFAQCTFEAPVTTSPFTSASISTCGKNLSFTPFCGGGNNIAGTGDVGTQDPSGVSIFQVTVGTNNTGLTWGVTSSTAGFFPEMALISGSCAAGNQCLIDDTNGTQTIAPVAAGTTASPNPGGSTQDPLPAGTYYLIVSSLIGGTTTACGSFTFALAGTLPVKLEKFSVD